ncbi:SpoIIIAH-like family protein [Bacillus dakarensis]|uniref:SpoIIIAH-like family protein n=1 Tax=Robertmurraya dakarensis TaxID=1926278 RepID=UPI000981E370|nr:SpoIIIAH-like family protein [Bacillus dakarensis]
MLLKKQTVWLLTMLSLVVVLSVYYITSPEQNGSEFAAVDEQKEEQTENTEESAATDAADEADSTEVEGEESIISSVASDEVFEGLRLKLDEERSKIKEELRDIMASTELPSDERGEAYDRIQKLDEISQKESVLETLIIAMGYEDALVRADGENVRITVKSNEPSASAANDIIQVVKNEIGQMQAVAVEFQPSK